MPRRRPKRLRSKPAPAVLCASRSGKRKQWTSESMLAALGAIKRGVPVKRAALEHGVPRSDRHLGKVTHGTKPGPVSYLTGSEETELSQFIEVIGKIGYGKTRKQIKGIAESVARDKGVLKKSRISDGWFRRFMQRQPHLRLRKGDATANVRMDAMDNIEAGLALLKEKEDKKKREAEEKEKRKVNREEKKKEREAQAKKKAEERLKKAAEKKKIPARKTSTQKRTSALQPKTRKQRKSCVMSTVASTSASTSEPPSLVLSPESASSAPGVSGAPLPSSAHAETTGLSASQSSNECCECLGTYAEDVRVGTGAEWVQCACGRWLHEECIDSVEYDENGGEKFCSFCIV